LEAGEKREGKKRGEKKKRDVSDGRKTPLLVEKISGYDLGSVIIHHHRYHCHQHHHCLRHLILSECARGDIVLKEFYHQRFLFFSLY